jgi:hypothetical protein
MHPGWCYWADRLCDYRDRALLQCAPEARPDACALCSHPSTTNPDIRASVVRARPQPQYLRCQRDISFQHPWCVRCLRRRCGSGHILCDLCTGLDKAIALDLFVPVLDLSLWTAHRLPSQPHPLLPSPPPRLAHRHLLRLGSLLAPSRLGCSWPRCTSPAPVDVLDAYDDRLRPAGCTARRPCRRTSTPCAAWMAADGSRSSWRSSGASRGIQRRRSRADVLSGSSRRCTPSSLGCISTTSASPFTGTLSA